MSGEEPSQARPDDPEDDDLVDPTVPVAERLGLTPPAQVVRAALNRARAAARARGLRPGSAGRTRTPPTEHRSGARADGRDPAPLGDVLSRLATEHGWSTGLSVGTVHARWPELVGDQVAEHCVPETFDEGVLVVRTDSTAWATHVSMFVPEMLDRIAEGVGADVVREVRVLGPAGPQWGKGGRRVPGRGPRDTYG